MRASAQPLLSTHLSVRYRGKSCVIRDARLEIRRGEILGLVGHSGSGKSTLALAILGLLNTESAEVEGSIQFCGMDSLHLSEREMRRIRGRSLALILQSPLTSLNPVLRIRTQLREAWRAHATGNSSQCEDAIRQALRSVSLPDDEEFLRRYSSQLSVGQAQRVLIAMAVMHRPALLIADEATSALDIITQSEILSLFARLSRDIQMSILYISHDLPSVASICHRIAILYEGAIVECGTTEQIFTNPRQLYTQQLIASLPKMPESAPKSVSAKAAGP